MNINDIFVSELDENEKRAKRLFGKLLINLRKNNRIKLYSMLGSVNKSNIIDDTIVIVVSDKTCFDMINNASDIASIQAELDQIEPGLKVKFECDGKESFDLYKFEERLREEFGRILTIK